MKSYLVAVALLVASSATFAQGAKVMSALNYIKFEPYELDKAKSNIDEAIEHPKTMSSAKTWFARGKVYSLIHITQDTTYNDIKKGALNTAVESLEKAKSFEDFDKKVDKDEFDNLYKMLSNYAFDYAVQKYNEKDYDGATMYFNKTAEIKSSYNEIDTLAYFNAGLACELNNKPEEAIKYYQKCLDVGYRGAEMYNDVANMFQRAKLDEKAFPVLAEGRKKYPTDQALLTNEINLYLRNEKFDEALGNLTLAIENDPSNASFYYARGTLYNRNGDNDKAEQDYLKAIELDQSNFDAYYNLGALYFNQGAEYVNKINQIKDNAKYAAEKKNADKIFEKSLPYLERALELNPDDNSTLQSLKQLYVRLGMNEKYKVIDEKIKSKN